MKARNPYTGEFDYEFTPTSPSELEAICGRLREAQPCWEKAGIAGRAETLREFGSAVARHRDALIESLVQDTGRYGISVREANLEPVIEREIAAALKFAREETVGETELPDVINRRQLASYALVGNITPWNFPCSMAFLDTIPALIAGCAVVVKPSEVAPRFIDVIERILKDVPELADVLAFVRGGGAVGAELIGQVDYVCFTGSVATGRKVYRAAAERFIPASLELGGKDPLIVLEGADPQEAAMSAVIGSCVASGQLCTSVERIYVAESLFEEFAQAVVDRARRVEINYPDIRHGFIGPFILEKQADTVREHIEDAVSKGARLHTGGEILEHGGKWCLPTVLTDVDHSMRIMREESFGPLLPIMPFASVDEAVRLANDSEYGLTASVFAGDSGEGEEVARALDAGGVSVNRAGITLMVRGIEQDAFKASGMGKNRMGREGIRRFARSKAIMTYAGEDDEIAPGLAAQIFTGR